MVDGPRVVVVVGSTVEVVVVGSGGVVVVVGSGTVVVVGSTVLTGAGGGLVVRRDLT